MLTYDEILQLHDAYCDSPDALYICTFSRAFAAAWQDSQQRDELCKLAQQFLCATGRESEWTAATLPSTRYDILFQPKNLRDCHTSRDGHTARHNIRFDFLNWLLEQPDSDATKRCKMTHKTLPYEPRNSTYYTQRPGS
jgi:hypothetical protein